MLQIYAIMQCMIYPPPSEAANSCWIVRQYGTYTSAAECKRIEEYVQGTAGGQHGSVNIKFQCVSKSTPAWKPAQ